MKLSIACSARLETKVECVLEALANRGHEGQLFTGDSAREALVSAEPRSLRVLFVPDGLERAQIDALERALDPEQLGNVLVTALDRSAPEVALRIESFGAAVALHQPRPARATPVRLTVPQASRPKPRTWLPPLGIAAVLVGGLIVFLQVGLRPAPTEAKAPVVGTPEPSPLADPEPEDALAGDEPITVSVEQPGPTDEEIEIFDIEPRRWKPRKKAADPDAQAPIETAGEATPPPLMPRITLSPGPTFPQQDHPIPGEERPLSL